MREGIMALGALAIALGLMFWSIPLFLAGFAIAALGGFLPDRSRPQKDPVLGLAELYGRLAVLEPSKRPQDVVAEAGFTESDIKQLIVKEGGYNQKVMNAVWSKYSDAAIAHGVEALNSTLADPRRRREQHQSGEDDSS